MKKIAIAQSNYIPWKGYFDMIAAVDEFVLFDDMQYTRRDWRNRNQIKTPQGTIWLTVPVLVKGKYQQKIRETKIDTTEWAANHWKSIVFNYSRSRNFNEIKELLEPLYLNKRYTNLSELNFLFIKEISDYLGIKTIISRSWDYEITEGKTERLVDLCRQTGATQYISGPAAKNYINTELFSNQGVNVTWFDYSGYPQYQQLWGDFIHEVSIIDLLFNCGNESSKFMKHVV